MKTTQIVLLLAAAAMLSGQAFAGNAVMPAPTGDACADLDAGIKAVRDQRIKDSMPKTDPTSFVQQGYDVKGILSQDVTAGFSKLMSLDFSSLANSLLNKGLAQAAASGQAQFASKMNGLLNSYGIGSVGFQSTSLGATGVAGQMVQRGTGAVAGSVNTAVQSAQTQVVNTVTSTVGTAVQQVQAAPQSIYSRAVPGSK